TVANSSGSAVMTRNLATDVANSTSGAWQLMASSARAPSSTRYVWRDQMLSTLRLVFLNRLVAFTSSPKRRYA
ncbi:hypothetical protein K0M31_013333, partial [Melipona bicolor]